ncbi:MAG: hypothetical protein EBZ13_14285, partial [Planctomycetia bacterium]|nr:hypothetical protein [Planctomycetia bacterium]
MIIESGPQSERGTDLMANTAALHHHRIDRHRYRCQPAVGGKPILNRWETMSESPATSPESDALAKDLKKRGFKFLGSTVMYA